MGWRDRDWAKWTDEERRRFYGSSGSNVSSATSTYSVGRGQGRLFGRRVRASHCFLAVIVSLLGALALGQLPRSRPLVPALHVGLPALPGSHKTGTLSLPGSSRLGSTLKLHGTLSPGGTGTVTVEGKYGRAPWQVLATVQVAGGAYETQIPLSRRGLLHIRVTYPDGHTAVGSTKVG